MVKKEVKDLKESKDTTQEKGKRGKSKWSDRAELEQWIGSSGTSIVLRSSNRLKEKANAAQMIEKDKGKRKQAPHDGNIEKAKTPQKKRNTNNETPLKKKVEGTKKSVAVGGASKKGSRSKSMKDSNLEVLRSSNRLKGKMNAETNADEKGKGKRKQAPGDRNVEKFESPQKRRNVVKETLANKKVEDPKKAKFVASKRGSYGRSNREHGAENDTEKSGFAGTSKISKSSSRLKRRADVEKEKGKGKSVLENGNAETIKSRRKRTEKKVENPRKSKEVARSKSKRDDIAESDKGGIDSAGTRKGLRSSNRFTEKVNADKMSIQKGKGKLTAKNEETNKSSQTRTKKKAERDEGSDLAEPIRDLRSSKKARGKANADENNKGKKNHAPEDRNVKKAESSQKERKADDDIAKEKKLPKKKVTDLGNKKDGQANVEKRKMPDRTCRSSSRTKK